MGNALRVELISMDTSKFMKILYQVLGLHPWATTFKAMTLKLRKVLRSKHSPIDSSWKKNPFTYIYILKGRDGNPSTRSARQIEAGEQMSRKNITITHH
jgi:hypothetical protein